MLRQSLGQLFGVDAEHRRDGNRGEQIHDIVPAQQRAAEEQRRAFAATGAATQTEAYPCGALAFGRFRSKVRFGVHSKGYRAAPVNLRELPNPLVIGIENGCSFFGEALNELSLGQGNLVDGSEILQMSRVDIGHHGDRGAGDFRQALNFAPMVHAHLQNDDLRGVVGPQQRQRQAQVIVEIALALRHSIARLKGRGDQIFCRRLAIAARNADHLPTPALPAAVSQPAQTPRGVIDGENWTYMAMLVRPTFLGNRRGRSFVEGRLDVAVAIVPRAANGEKQISRLQGARVDRVPCH